MFNYFVIISCQKNGILRCFKIAMPETIVKGCPLKVPPAKIGGVLSEPEKAFITLFDPATTPIGIPPTTAFPLVSTSGKMLLYSWQPPYSIL